MRVRISVLVIFGVLSLAGLMGCGGGKDTGPSIANTGLVLKPLPAPAAPGGGGGQKAAGQGVGSQ